MYLEINFALKRDPRRAPLNGTSCVEEGWYCTRKHNNPQYYKACHSNYVSECLILSSQMYWPVLVWLPL